MVTHCAITHPFTLTEYDDSPEVEKEALDTFELLTDNIYIGSATGKAAAEEALGCQCKFDPDVDDISMACGEQSDCINRILYIECKRDACSVGGYCQNRRFQKKSYANVKLIKTQLKGFGLAAAENLESGQFIMEYIGEVVSKTQFNKRTQIYEQDNIEHHYFMSIRNDEVIDATRKGCIARFVNHSCAPNCEVQKWVVGSRFRMGIFTTKPVPQGKELTFDYKFVRYGAAPQRCFCGEPNCKGFIGVMKEPQFTDALSGEVDLDEEMESQEISSRQKAKVHEDDEEYHDPTMPQPAAAHPSNRGLNSPEDVVKFIKVMIGAAGKPNLALKLLSKLQDTTEVAYLRSFIRMHGVPLLKSLLLEYSHDTNICTEVLKCFALLPISKRNTVDDHKLTEQLESLKIRDDNDPMVQELCTELIDKWKHLVTVYRIPKMKVKKNQSATAGGGSESDGRTPASRASSPADLGPDGFMSPKRKWNDGPAGREKRIAYGLTSSGSTTGDTPTSTLSALAVTSSSSPYHRSSLDRTHSETSLSGRRGYDSYRSEPRSRYPGSTTMPTPSNRHYESGLHSSASRSATSIPTDHRHNVPGSGDRDRQRERSRSRDRDRDRSHYHSSPSRRDSRYSDDNRRTSSSYRPHSDYPYHSSSSSRYGSGEYQQYRPSSGRDDRRSRRCSGESRDHRESDLNRAVSPLLDSSPHPKNHGTASSGNGSTRPARRSVTLSNTPSPHETQRAGLPLEMGAGTTTTTTTIGLGTPSGKAGPDEPSSDLPPDWRSTTAPNGRVYYYHILTGETQWNKPCLDMTTEGVSRAQLDEVIRNATLNFSRNTSSQSLKQSGEGDKNKHTDADADNDAAGPTKLGGSGDKRHHHGSTSASASTKVDGSSSKSSKHHHHSGASRTISSSTSAGAANGGPKTSENELAVKEAVAAVVTKALSRFKTQLDKEPFKKMARKITQILLEKEYRSPSFNFSRLTDMPTAKKMKMKKFVEEYATKSLSQAGCGGGGVATTTPTATSDHSTAASTSASTPANTMSDSISYSPF
ncbi:hypothetical protein BJ085DRAFT_31547 [Dimargaris cristalligena]|uniref:[histone H3]-lysine(36) N-trimethyltransferase n=1 Tax=Dimargaris cristalligena TaxID=215637 RepID=A0A4P9ZV84_9FUNG|nr:hypothetical protein BJ085DRAFT_31547 [Dimargaris cristalligena]|eukprot:RKP37483.1 hypothetical protein BJ085DRAFT_31547 [Dimargaris cristalligena]